MMGGRTVIEFSRLLPLRVRTGLLQRKLVDALNFHTRRDQLLEISAAKSASFEGYAAAERVANPERSRAVTSVLRLLAPNGGHTSVGSR